MQPHPFSPNDQCCWIRAEDGQDSPPACLKPGYLPLTASNSPPHAHLSQQVIRRDVHKTRTSNTLSCLYRTIIPSRFAMQNSPGKAHPCAILYGKCDSRLPSTTPLPPSLLQVLHRAIPPLKLYHHIRCDMGTQHHPPHTLRRSSPARANRNSPSFPATLRRDPNPSSSRKPTSI